MLLWFDMTFDARPKKLISRRRFNGLAAGAFGVLAGAAGAGAAEHRYSPLVMEQGYYTWDWFLPSFLELADDLEAASAGGKRLVLLWEQEGCPYCREMHMVNLAIPEIHDYIRDNFDVLQLDIHGVRDMVDFDGAAITERDLAKRSAVRYTPTLQFFPESLADMAGLIGKDAEVARMPGYLEPVYFMMFFEFVREKAYVGGDFRDYLKARLAAYKTTGRPLQSW